MSRKNKIALPKGEKSRRKRAARSLRAAVAPANR